MSDVIIIDPGEAFVKVVIIEKALKSMLIKDIFIFKTKYTDPLSDIKRVFKENIGGYVNENTEFIIIYPHKRSFYRVLSLPFKDRKKIERFVPFEFERELPYSSDEIQTAFIMLNGKNLPVRILASAVDKKEFKVFLESIEADGISPSVIIPGGSGLINYIKYINKRTLREQNGLASYGVVDIGASKTSAIFTDGFNAMFVLTGYGDSRILSNIKKLHGFADEEINRLRCEKSITENIPLVREFREFYTNISKRVSIGIKAYETRIFSKIDKIYITGGGAYFKDIDGWFSESIGIACSILDPTEMIQCKKVIETQDKLLLGPIFGEIVGFNNGFDLINLRCGEFIKKSDIEATKKTAYILLSLLGIYSVISIGTDIAKYRLVKKDYEMKRVIEANILKETFTDVKDIVDPYSQMKERVERNKVIQKKGGANIDNIDIIKSILLAFPENIFLKLDEFFIDGDKIKLSGKTSSLEGVDKFEKNLKGIKFFKEIKVTQTRMSTGGDGYDFRIAISM